MRIVALETTERTGTIALLDGASVVATASLNPQQRSAQSLAVGLRDLLSENQWQTKDIQLVAVAAGPGSFTGLRVGVTAAKTLAYAAGADVLGVDTLEVIAEAVENDTSQPLWAVMDAQRDQLFAAQFQRHDGTWRNTVPTRIVDFDELLDHLQHGGCVTGPVLEKIEPRMPDSVTVVDSTLWSPSASQVGMVAWRRYSAGERQDLWRLVPQYYRRSAAEEKAEEKADAKATDAKPND